MSVNPAEYLAPPSCKGFPTTLNDPEVVPALEQWLLDCGWEKKSTDKGDINVWWLIQLTDTTRRGHAKEAMTFRSAVYQNAMWETAKLLREMDWFAPHRRGHPCGLQVAICRPPGSFVRHPGTDTCTPIKGKRGRWMTLREAAREAGLLTP